MNEGLDLRYYLFVAKRRFWHFLLPMLGALALGVGAIVSLPKVYNSSATILVEGPKVGPNILGESSDSADVIERLQALKTRILARENLLKIVDKFLLFKDRRDMSRNDIVDLMNERVTFDTIEVNKSIKSAGNEKSAVVFSIGFDSENPESANKVANELMTMVMEEDASIRRAVGEDTVKFVEREVGRITRELSDLDEKISAFKIQNTSMLPEKLAFNMQALDKQQQEITLIDRDEVAGRNQMILLEIESKQRQLEGPKTLTQNGTYQPGLTLDAQLEQKELELRAALLTFAKSHPTIRKLERDVAALKSQIDASKGKAIDLKKLDSKDPSLSGDLQIIAQKREMIEQQLKLNIKRRADLVKTSTELQAVINRTPEIDAQLKALERAREALQANLDANRVKLNEAKVKLEAIIAQIAQKFVVVEAPVTPIDPVRPKVPQLLILALASALGLGGATAFGAEYLDSTIRRSRDLKQKLNTRVIVTIPYIRTRSEVRRNRGTTSLYLLGFLAVLAGVLLLIHLFYQSLDVLYFSLINRF